MKGFGGVVLVGAALSLAGSLASAQEEGDGDGLDVTITLLPEQVELPDAVTRDLELPRDDEGEFRPAPQAVENSAEALANATAARDEGRTFGLETAQENRENAGRESRPDLDDLPDQVPDLPNVPDLPDGPDLPDTPAGPPGPPR